MVLTRLEAEATQTREAQRVTAQRTAVAVADERARALTAAQELETKTMERHVVYAGRVSLSRYWALFADLKSREMDL